MSKVPYVPPKHGKRLFNCPYCHAFASQIFSREMLEFMDRSSGYRINLPIMVSASECVYCHKTCLWLNGNLAIPNVSGMPPPNSDLNEDIQQLYNEASSVFNISPRAAAVLLRGALGRMLSEQLQEKGKDIYKILENFKDESKFPPEIVAYMDAIRKVGNSAAHPQQNSLLPQINFNEKPEITRFLFNFINYIAEEVITKPREKKEQLEKLQSELKAVIPDNKDTQ